jgi:hypothetical protein
VGEDDRARRVEIGRVERGETRRAEEPEAGPHLVIEPFEHAHEVGVPVDGEPDARGLWQGSWRARPGAGSRISASCLPRLRSVATRSFSAAEPAGEKIVATAAPPNTR